MNEGQRKPNLPVEKPNYFPGHGELTRQERKLAESLDIYTENLRISLTGLGEDLVSKANIKIDEKRANDLQAMFERRDKTLSIANQEAIERGTLAEHAIIFGMQEGEWLGTGSTVRVATKHDDIENGVDCIVDLDSTKHLAIGIDTTISANKITEKLQRIRDKILDGKLAEVKYFKNENYTGSLHNVPLTIIGISAEANSSLAGLIYDIEMTDQAHSEDKLDKKEIAQREIKAHEIQFIILFEIRMQLEFFIQFIMKYKEMNKDKPEDKLMVNADKFIKKLQEELEKIKEVMTAKAPKDKAKREKLMTDIKNDAVFKMIKHTLQVEFTQSDFTKRKPKEQPKILVAKMK